MKKSGLLIAAGVIAVVRGSLGTLSGLGTLPNMDALEEMLPGIGVAISFELILSVVVLVVGVYALVKANDPDSAGALRGWGIAIIVAGIIDLMWIAQLANGASDALASGLGSVAALTLIGSLLIAGANGLLRARRA